MVSACFDTCCHPDDDVDVVHIAEVVRCSRRDRTCAWCYETIFAGQRYRRFVDKVDGTMQAIDGCLGAPQCIYGEFG